MMDETNELQNSAESAEIQFSLESQRAINFTDCPGKANVTLQYTVAVKVKISRHIRK